MANEWGTLDALAGEWQGEGGLDTAYSNSKGEVIATPYLEKLTMKPFGPVDNGEQCLYGLDYRMAAWRDGHDDPFHTEVGYWLWDGATGEVLRGFVVPRGITVLAGGIADADATTWTMYAKQGDPQYAIGENRYLAEHAATVSYDLAITLNDDGSWSYEESTMLKMSAMRGELFAHTDRNTLKRVG